MIDIKYSIIIPHHNIPQLLRRCLNSLPIRNDIQVIVVDDNSSNIHQNLLLELAKEFYFVDFIFSTKSKGAGAARNLGLSKAKGLWVIFIDADDFLLDNAISVWDKHYNSNSDIIYFNVKSVDCETLRPSNRHFHKYNNTFRLRNYSSKLYTWLRYEYTEPWGKMIKRSLILNNNILFYESKVANDYYFSVKTGHCAKDIEFDKESFYCVTVRKGSLCNKTFDSYNKIKNRLVAYKFVEDFFIENKIPLYPCSNFAIKMLFRKIKHFKHYYNLLRELDFTFIDIFIKFPIRYIRFIPKKVFEVLKLPILGYYTKNN